MAMRENVSFSGELEQILIADVVLIIAFSLTLSNGVIGILATPGTFYSKFLYSLPIVAVAVTLSFILHELMHKFTAQHFGAIAGFRYSNMGLLITLITGAAGFLFGIPGATVIYVQSFTKRENGIVSLAGPLTNFVVFLAFLGIGVFLHPAVNSYLYNMVAFTIFISLLLAFFNMLPIYPLDGSKVLAWSKEIYFLTMGVLVLLMYFFAGVPIGSLIYLFLLALLLSAFYRNVL